MMPILARIDDTIFRLKTLRAEMITDQVRCRTCGIEIVSLEVELTDLKKELLECLGHVTVL